MRNVLNKYSVRTPVKRRKTAVYSRNRTVASQDFVSTAFLRYGAYPYSAVFCTAVAVYGTVVSPSTELPVHRMFSGALMKMNIGKLSNVLKARACLD